ncbi:MAG: tetratricopeptide repeat protein [bacterium]
MTKPKKDNTTPAQPSSTYNHYSYVRWLALAIAVLYFLPALGIISKTSFWAFSVNTYWPTALMIAHITLITSGCLLLFKPDLLRFTDKVSTKFYYAFFACVLIIFAVVLREKVPFYGDGYFFQKDIITNLPIKYAEVLTMLIYRAVYIALPESSRTGAAAYQLVNTLCVVPAVITLLFLARNTRREYLPFILFTFLGLGANVLFFGHVENYTPVYVAMLLYLYVSTRPKTNIALLAFLLGISICLHLLALCLIPSFLYILWKSRTSMPKWRLLLFSVTLFLLPFVITMLFSAVARMTPSQLYKEIATSITTLPEHTGQNYFASIINVHHWLDILNLLFLGLPIFPIVALLVFTNGKNRAAGHSQDLQIILVLGVPFILFIMFFNTPLGLARDWDIGVTALVWRVAAIIFLAKQRAPKIRIEPSLLTSLGLLAFLISLPWLAIHHFPQLGVKRFHDILGARPALSGTAYGYEILGRYYHDTEDYRNSVKSYENASRYDPQNWRRYYSVAMEYLNLREPAPALSNLLKSHEINPNELMVLNELGMLYHNVGQDDSALMMFQQIYQQDSIEIANRHNLGCAYYWAGQYKAALDVFTGILKDYPDHFHATLGLVDVMIATGDLKQAERLIERLESRYGKNQTTQQYRKILK